MIKKVIGEIINSIIAGTEQILDTCNPKNPTD
jgi:hypothetical protein